VLVAAEGFGVFSFADEQQEGPGGGETGLRKSRYAAGRAHAGGASRNEVCPVPRSHTRCAHTPHPHDTPQTREHPDAEGGGEAGQPRGRQGT